MANTSATGGILTPASSPAPLSDDALEDFFQEWVVGLTSFDPALVRPRWQAEPPNIPDTNTNWISLGITKTSPDTFAAELHYSNPSSYNEVRRHEELEILVSGYGPQSSSILSILRDGMQVAQNREILSLNNMGLISSGDILAVPELIKNIWTKRHDMRFWIRRQVKRNYGVLDLAEAQGTLNNELYIEQITVRENP